MKTVPVWLGHLLAGIVSPQVAFFFVLNFLFSDVIATSQRIQAVAMILMLYFILAWVFGRLWPHHKRAWQWWLILPAGLMALSFMISDGAYSFYSFGIVLAMISGTLLGLLVAKPPRPRVV